MRHRIAALCTFVVFGLISSASAAGEKPNIVILLADDLGYADIGANGCRDIPTPNIDAIATAGVRFTDGYSNHPVCCPSRAGLLSGLYPHRFGFEHNSGPEQFAAPNFGIPRAIPILPEKLRAAGYATAITGKWHVGFKEGLRPHERGFDFSYCFLGGQHTYTPGNRDAPIFRNGEPIEETAYLTDALAREAVDFIDRSAEKPFFLYVPFNAVHAPMEATASYTGRFPGIADPTRKTFAGMLSAMDDAVGRIMEKLRERGLEDNTLVIFYSDNGGPTAQTSSRNDPLRGFKTQVYEGGIRVPFLMQWKGTLPEGMTYSQPIMGFDAHATALAAAGLATSADRPLDGVDLVPFLKGSSEGAPHEALFWRAGRQHAARQGDWKIVRNAGGAGDQLFNLRDDIGESTDIAGINQAKLKELQAVYDSWDRQMMPAQWVRQTRPAGDGRTTEE